MITGEQGLFARANYAANLYKGAQQNEAEAINAILNNEYLSGLLSFSLSATATDTSITISGQTTGNGTVSYKYAILETAGEVDWDSITETTDISKTFTTLMDGSTALTKGKTYYVYMQAIDEEGQAQLAGNNGLDIKAVTPTNGTTANGSYDEIDGVNSPDISKLPVASTYYVQWESNTSDTTELKVSENDIPIDWYDYDSGKWANIKSENAVDNTLLEAYWVWVPRYAYKLPEAARGSEKMIEVMFLENDTNYGYVNNTRTQAYKSTSSTITSDRSGLYSKATSTAKGGAWIVHPAFTFGTTELNGIWVAKFEASNSSCTATESTGNQSSNNNGNTKLTVKPNVTAWRNVQLASAFTSCENAVKTGGVIGNNSNNLDCHPAKNMEWGCVAILSQSAYGIFSSGSTINSSNTSGKLRIWNNSSKDFITGSVGSSPDAKSDDTTTDTTGAYNSTNGAKASTTGTIYGVYDMAGGSWEYVMGLQAPNNDSTVGSVGNSSSYNTGFTGKLYDGTSITGSRDLPDRKYYDLYSYGTSRTDYSRGYIGEATSELQPAASGSDGYTWNDDYANFVRSDYPVFGRDGWYGVGTDAGVFEFYLGTGEAFSLYSFRPVLVCT